MRRAMYAGRFVGRMWDLPTARLVAAALVAGTAVGAVLLWRSVNRSPRLARRVVARRDPARWTEVVWLMGILVAQVWSLGVCVAPAVFYAWPLPGDFSGSEAVQTLGLGLWVVGGGLIAWAGRSLGHFMTPKIQVTEDHRLVQEGPYAWIRHPTYVANVLVTLGLGLAFLSPALLLLAGSMAAIAQYRARLEEGLLRSTEGFGSAYDAYMEKTGRFLPRWPGAGR